MTNRMRPRLAAWLGTASLLFAPGAGAGVVYVNAASSPGGAGTSWANAYDSLQPGLDAAALGDEVWVAQGTYTTPGQAFVMREGTSLLGGFSGSETSAAEADPFAFPTILDAQKANRCLEMTGSGPVVLDGFFLRNGLTGEKGGGALYEYDLHAEISRCVFEGNKAMDGAGGAVRFYSGVVSFTDCDFIENVAGNKEGGAVSNYQGDVWFERCEFDGNESIVAAAYESYTGSCTLLNCLFVRNHAFGPASICDTYQAQIRIVNCTATMNVAEGAHSVAGSQTSVEVHNSIFHGNDCFLEEFAPSVEVTYSLVEDGHPGTGNLQGDPNFLSPSTDDFRPLHPSPAIDASDNNVIPAGVTIDLDGNPRFIDLAVVPDVGNGPPPLADMGALESTCEAPPVTFGEGCIGAGVLIPQIEVNACPAIGSQLSLAFTNALGGSTAVVFAGTGMTEIPMTADCSFLVSPVLPPIFSLPLGGTGAGNGHAVLTGTVPPSTPVGAVVTWQFFVADPFAGDGFAASPGLRLVFN